MRARHQLSGDGLVRVGVGQIAAAVVSGGGGRRETGRGGGGSDEVRAAVAAGEALGDDGGCGAEVGEAAGAAEEGVGAGEVGGRRGRADRDRGVCADAGAGVGGGCAAASAEGQGRQEVGWEEGCGRGGERHFRSTRLFSCDGRRGNSPAIVVRYVLVVSSSHVHTVGVMARSIALLITLSLPQTSAPPWCGGRSKRPERLERKGRRIMESSRDKEEKRSCSRSPAVVECRYGVDRLTI